MSTLGIDPELITCLAVIIGPSMGMFRGAGLSTTRSTDTRGPSFEYFSQELDRRLPSPRFRLRMQSSFGCFVADSSLARKAVLRVTVKVNLPVRLRESHFFSKCNHTFQWHHRVVITVQDEDLGHDSSRSHSHRRAQNAVQGDDTSQRSGGTRKLENAAASNTVSDGRDAIRVALRSPLKCS